MTEGGAGMRNADVGDNPSFRASTLRRLGSHYITDQMPPTRQLQLKIFLLD